MIRLMSKTTGEKAVRDDFPKSNFKTTYSISGLLAWGPRVHIHSPSQYSTPSHAQRS